MPFVDRNCEVHDNAPNYSHAMSALVAPETRVMHFDTIITNGTIVNANKSEKADVGIVGEKIAAVGKGLAKKAGKNGATIIDAKGHYVIPGGVDVHVHLALPFCGTTSSDDYNTGTRAAARGGVTTLIDFAIPYGDESLQQAVDNWMAKADGKACIDYTSRRRHQVGPAQAPDGRHGEEGLPDVQGVHDL